MKLGILMGSFDPIHAGHLYMATNAINEGYVDKVIFVPTMQNPWKENSTDWFTRCNMITSSLKDVNNCSISFIEAELKEPYYSSNTLKAIQKEYPNDELYLIVGADTSLNIIYWNEGEWILNNFKLITVARQDYTANCDIKQSINVSSTQIRELAKQDKILFPLVTKEVEYIINTNNLYKNEKFSNN